MQLDSKESSSSDRDGDGEYASSSPSMLRNGALGKDLDDNDENTSLELPMSSMDITETLPLYRQSAILNVLSASSSCVLQPFQDETGHPVHIVRGLGTIFCLGTILGLLSPPDANHTNSSFATPSWYPMASNVLGYTYTLCWSVALYPQVLSNHRRRSTKGLSVDFVLLNVIGFACYAVYSGAFLWNDSVRIAYEADMSQSPTVRFNDMVLCVHALVVLIALCGQIVVYDGFVWARDVTKVVRWVLTGMMMVSLGCPVVLLVFATKDNDGGGPNAYLWLEYLYILSYIKVLTTLIKYIPQAYLNHKRKSTVGWNIWRTLLDFAGGILSTAQLLGDATALGDWRAGVTGNPAKLGLGTMSMAFAVLFMFQHYVLYPQVKEPELQSSSQRDIEPLL